MEKRSAECLETVKREHTVPQRPVFICIQWSALPFESRWEKRKRLLWFSALEQLWRQFRARMTVIYLRLLKHHSFLIGFYCISSKTEKGETDWGYFLFIFYLFIFYKLLIISVSLFKNVSTNGLRITDALTIAMSHYSLPQVCAKYLILLTQTHNTHNLCPWSQPCKVYRQPNSSPNFQPPYKI